jgi:serine/threonine protein kinase
MNYRNLKNQTVFLSKNKLDKGGEGDIYKIEQPSNLNNMVAKIFRKNPSQKQEKFDEKLKKKEEKILYIIEHLIPKLSKSKYFKYMIFPVDLLYDESNRCIGYIMSLVENMIPLTNIENNFFKDPSFQIFNIKKTKDKDLAFLNRLIVSFNIVKIIQEIHAIKDIVLVDLKPDNMMASAKGEVCLIDLDSVQISNQKDFLSAEVLTPEYTLPESKNINYKKQAFDHSWDRFIVAMIVYKLLVGINPFSAVYKDITTQEDMLLKGIFVHGKYSKDIDLPPKHTQNKFFDLDKDLQDLFMQYFDNGTLDLTKRPDLDEFEKVLEKYIKEEQSSLIIPTVQFSLKNQLLTWDVKDAQDIKLVAYLKQVNGTYTKYQSIDIKEIDTKKVFLEDSKYELIAKNKKRTVKKELIFTLPSANIDFELIDDTLVWDVKDAIDIKLETYHISYKGGYIFKGSEQISSTGKKIIPLFNSYYKIKAFNGLKESIKKVTVL